jgi:hypothetical protein
VILQIKPDGTVLWKGREVESDADFRAAMMEVHQHMCGSANAEIERLRADLAQRTAERAKANAERDAARREACALRVLCTTTSKNCEQIAAERGWDCFKEVRP